MKRILLILLITFFSCSEDENSGCQSEKQQVIDEYNERIQMALDGGDEAQAEVLIRNKEIRLEGFDC